MCIVIDAIVRFSSHVKRKHQIQCTQDKSRRAKEIDVYIIQRIQNNGSKDNGGYSARGAERVVAGIMPVFEIGRKIRNNDSQ